MDKVTASASKSARYCFRSRPYAGWWRGLPQERALLAKVFIARIRLPGTPLTTGDYNDRL
ncbi:MAG: hypothetical protein RQ741_11960 [Wenzhouxiangellaceae bacterium]|nr:hypothetical protein [Wenzhouxiangellaceae bacterium]